MRAALAIAAALAPAAAGGVPKVPLVKLNNGVMMPALSFGAAVWDDPTCLSATKLAIDAGFRFIWSSALIGSSCQRQQAAAIAASGLKREEFFLSGTVNTGSCSGRDECYKQTKGDAEDQFYTLNQTTLDMLMLDYPSAQPGCDSVLGQWAAFEELYAAKRVRTIGVSNFSPEQLKCITANASATVPVANQLQYSVGHGGDSVVADEARMGVVVQAYSPLNGGSLATDADCAKIGQAHNKSAAQVALRWIIQRNATICTESTHKEFLDLDIDIFDFQLTGAEMATLNAK
eukprot:TRINITY_DN13148_c0_g1_i1.p1 TRINITY_DN13148_c0_g1~~TRINITY_DN13148_c0_g1_i1.p1  ORF type:complete len:289 (+),score=121.86 TRINITY_DN13148_c0_g1_i1:79-945(+)